MANPKMREILADGSGIGVVASADRLLPCLAFIEQWERRPSKIPIKHRVAGIGRVCCIGLPAVLGRPHTLYTKTHFSFGLWGVSFQQARVYVSLPQNPSEIDIDLL